MEELKVEEKDGKIFCPLKNKWLIATPEEKVRQKWITVLVNKYGYSLNQMAQEIKVNNSSRGQGKARADIVVWKNEQDKAEDANAFIVVECKAENVKIHEEDYYQGANYATWAHADFFVTTNEKETKYFNVDPKHLPQKLQEVVDIPSIEDVNNEKEIEKLKNQTKTFTREEFTKLLRSCHNVIRNNDKLSPEAAFDEISKILFMKIQYEREEKDSGIFTLKKYKKLESYYEKYTRPALKKSGVDLPFMQLMFKQTKEAFKADQIFDDNEVIKIRENSFEQILEKLQTYNLSDTQDDVKGIAFEQFLGTTFRGELGQFFTPRTIVDFMTEILDPQEGETICDPTCGSGGFLIKAFEYVRGHIEDDIRKQKEKLRAEIEGKNYEKLPENEQLKITEKVDAMHRALNSELDTQKEGSRMYNLSHNCIFGTDANPRMARTSKMNMIMHGDGHGGVHHHDGLLNVNGIFEERFDVILTNPPFGSRVDKNQKITEADKFTDKELIEKYRERYGVEYDNALNQVNDNIGQPLLSLYDTGKMSGLTEVLFMERCLRLLKKGGRMGMVLPEGVLNNPKLQKIREFFEGRAKLLLICSVPQDVFIAAGATVKPSLVFMKRFTEEEEREYNKAKDKAYKEVGKKYEEEINVLDSELKILNEKNKKTKEDRARIKEIGKRKEVIDALIQEEAKPLTKKNFDYEIFVAKVEDAGITSSGAKSENKQLPILIKQYKRYRQGKKLNEDKLNNFKIVLFSNFGNWDCKQFFDIQICSKYSVEKLGKHIVHETSRIKPYEQPNNEFYILGVANDKGMFDAYVEKGKNIKQAYKKVKDGFIAYNPYRVNIGSIGIKTEEQKYDLISPAYVVFSCKESLLPEYIFLLMKTKFFNKLICDNTTGSVRQILSFDNLANISIPVPSVEEQKKLLKNIKCISDEIKSLENKMCQAQQEFEEVVFSEA